MNFVVRNSLGGGGTMCLRLDPVAKSMAQLLLEFPVPVSEEVARNIDSLEPA